MKQLVIYVHGKGGSAKEAEHYKSLFDGSDVIGFDYKSKNPWEAKREFSQYYDLHSEGYESVVLIADMMMWSNVTEDELRNKKEIPTEFGETLSWEYLCYVRNNPVAWSIPTTVLYGENDNLTSLDTVREFTNKVGASLTVMENGEHWFHTDNQMKFLDSWIIDSVRPLSAFG